MIEIRQEVSKGSEKINREGYEKVPLFKKYSMVIPEEKITNF